MSPFLRHYVTLMPLRYLYDAAAAAPYAITHILRDAIHDMLCCYFNEYY